MDMQNEAAAALSGARPPQAGQPAPPQGAQPQQGQQSGIGQFMAAYARCEQTKQCSPQDKQVLEQGLPNLIQIAKNVQMILQSSAQPPQGQQPAPAQGQ